MNYEHYWATWKTVDNNANYCTESEHPLLKKDEHHAEIVDVTDGLVVEDSLFIYSIDNLKNHETMSHGNIWDAFGKETIDKNRNLNKKYI